MSRHRAIPLPSDKKTQRNPHRSAAGKQDRGHPVSRITAGSAEAVPRKGWKSPGTANLSVSGSANWNLWIRHLRPFVPHQPVQIAPSPSFL